MKKLFALMMVLVLSMSVMAGCGKKVKLVILETEYTTEDYAIAVAKDNKELYNKINTALQELIDDGTVKKVVDKYISGKEHDLKLQENVTKDAEVLTMATNAAFPPYEYYDADEKIIGIDAEVAAAIADKLGMKLVISDMEFDAIIPAVQSGKADMGMAGMTVTEDRLLEVDFTVSYATGVQVIIVAEGSKIKSVDDLFADGAFHKIGVQEATTGDLYSTWDLEDPEEGESKAEVLRYKKGADAIQALVTGKVDCVIIDSEPAKAFVAQNNK